MRSPDNTSGKPESFIFSGGLEWRDSQDVFPSVLLDCLKRPSNHIIIKRPNDSLEGLRYIVTPEPSSLRPVKSWAINIERWTCCSMANITAEDVLFIRILNTVNDGFDAEETVVKDIIVRNEKVSKDKQVVFNAIIAAGVLINKIDAGRFPDINKILETYKLI